MSVLSDGFGRKPADRAAKQRRFWHGLAERLDALAAYPTGTRFPNRSCARSTTISNAAGN
jgi:hypothetical protein